jgi:hypothetical protein
MSHAHESDDSDFEGQDEEDIEDTLKEAEEGVGEAEVNAEMEALQEEAEM